MNDNNGDNSARKRNPNILHILDPMHRSLLSSNMRYEQDYYQRSSEDEQSLRGNDSDEYFTPLSTIISTDSGTDCGAVSTQARASTSTKPANQRANGRPSLQPHTSYVDAINKTDLVRSSYFADGSDRLKTKHIKSAEHLKRSSKQTSDVLTTKNRCITNGFRRSTGTVERIKPTTESKSQRQKPSRNSLDSSRALRHISSSACTKRKQRAHAKVYSDSSDINSEANLVIENMRNRESEMFRKISFNNGYFSTTGSSSDYMYCTSDTNTIESTHGMHCKQWAKEMSRCNGCHSNAPTTKSPKLASRRKCRSFPLANGVGRHDRDTNECETRTQVNANGLVLRPLQNTEQRNNIECTTTETKTYQNTRKITITIKAKAMPAGVSVCASETKRMQSKQLQTSVCESSEETDSSANVSSGEPNANSDSSQSCRIAEHHTPNDTVLHDSSSDGGSFFSLSSSDAECVSESSQYFNCMSFTDLSVLNSHSTERIDNKCTDHIDMHDKILPSQVNKTAKSSEQARCATMMPVARRSSDPMILIEQELSKNCVLTSKVKVDKEKIKQFKSGLKKRVQCQSIVDNSFSKEIFDKTIHLDRQNGLSCDRDVINSIVSSLEKQANAHNQCNKSSKPSKRVQNEHQMFIGDGFMFDKLHASPKFTGKSISRLLAHRLEQNTVTSARRDLLQNVAYAITEKEQRVRMEKKRMTELAPIKPPRSFAASASSSPLSKQSFESSATVPISELNKIAAAPMGFSIPTIPLLSIEQQSHKKGDSHVGEAHSVHFGWIRPQSNIDNDSATVAEYVTAAPFASPSYCDSGSLMQAPIKNDNNRNIQPKEDIDTVDSGKHSNNEFAQFTANLKDNRGTHYSTPIKLAKSLNINNEMSCDAKSAYETVQMCEKCHCIKDKSPKILSSKTGKKIGKAALKRTKTLIGTSKKLLQKPLARQPQSDKHSQQKKSEQVTTSETLMKAGDNTVYNNCDRSGQDGYCAKRIDKSLNLTLKEVNRKPIVLQESPTRTVNISNVQLLKDAPTTIIDKAHDVAHLTLDSEVYATPEEGTFDFGRVVSVPQPTKKNQSLKRSPTKVIAMLAKSSRNFFRSSKQRNTAKCTNLDESTHYYTPNNYDELDHKVLLMNEVLAEMRKRIEMGQASSNDDIDGAISDRPASAKKCLFRNRTISTSSGDLLEDDSIVEKVARIDLHDEPEPLYAEIEANKFVGNDIGSETMYRSCVDDSRIELSNVGGVNGESVKLREVYIIDGADASQRNKYIMVNNDPRQLYATVNRSCSRQANSCRSSIDVVDGKSYTTSSYESLDLSLINDFAKTVQTELDECQFRLNGTLSTVNEASHYTECDTRSNLSSSESLPASSDMNSGCSSFYRRSKRIVDNTRRSDDPANLLDTMSFDTIATDSYCESINRGNDLNSEIKDTITSLENMPSDVATECSSSMSHDFSLNDATFRSCADANQLDDSNKFVSFSQHESGSTTSSPGSSLYRALAKNDSLFSGKAKGMSPKLKYLRSKLRKSFRMDGDKSARDKTIFEDCYEENDSDAHSTNSKTSYSSVGLSIADTKRQQFFESICRQIKNVPRDRFNVIAMERLIDVVRQQQIVRSQVQSALDVCRSTDEFQNSRELIEAEQLMLMTCLKEYSALEQLIALWHGDCSQSRNDNNLSVFGTGTFTIKYLEFRLTNDSIFNTHFNYFYLCVCTYRDQVAFTMAKERTSNSIVFDDIRLQFNNLTADFQIRVEVFALRLRKLARKDKASDIPKNSQCQISRFRLQGKTQLNSVNLSRKMSSSYHSPHNLERLSSGRYSYSSYGLISPSLVHCGQGSMLSGSIRIGYQEQLIFDNSIANGFLNIADANQKWDRLWCRIDGLTMNFWKYPQDRSDDAHAPILTLDLTRSNHRDKTLLVDREICAKPRTFKIDMLNATDSTHEINQQRTQTFFISAESQLDLELWLSEIQRIHKIIGNWNVQSSS